MLRLGMALAAALLLGAWMHGGSGILITNGASDLLTNANGDLLNR